MARAAADARPSAEAGLPFAARLRAWFFCAMEWALPGMGYLLLGRLGRAAVASLGVALLFGSGLLLEGALDRPAANEILGYLASFACLGVGLPYLGVTSSEALRRGLGDVNSATFEYGTTFLRAAGLIGYLLVLDVYDIAVGRKG